MHGAFHAALMRALQSEIQPLLCLRILPFENWVVGFVGKLGTRGSSRVCDVRMVVGLATQDNGSMLPFRTSRTN